MERIYLDHNATTPVRPEVVEAMLPFLTANFGNASSMHPEGQKARRALEDAREKMAAVRRRRGSVRDHFHLRRNRVEQHGDQGRA